MNMLNQALSGSALALRLIGLRRQIDLLELEFSRVAAAYAETDHWDEEGSLSPIDWIRFNCRMTHHAVADRVAVGERLGGLAESAQSVRSGEIGFAHLTVMARTANAVGERFDEAALLAQARECSPGKFHYRCLHYRHAVDAKGYADEQSELAESRHLSLSTAQDGCLLINGVLDPVGGAAVRGALEPLARPCGDHDGRNREQRLADALVDLACGSQPVQLQVTSSLETLLGLWGAPAGEMEFSLPVSSKTVERLACDSSVARILMQDSVVVDVGRSKRIVTAPARRALEARDGHCRWPHCDRPAKWSAAHHVVHWINGGSTDLENLVLLCHRHHRMVHEGGWQLVRTEDGALVTVGPMTTFGLKQHAPGSATWAAAFSTG